MVELLRLLSNREMSIIIWALIFILVLVIKSIISQARPWTIINLLFAKIFIPFYIIIGLYFYIIISLLQELSIWECSLYKDFVYWLLTTAMVLFFRANNLETYKDFINIILTAISTTIILEFIINFYNFSLIGELIFIPLVTIIAFLTLMTEKKKDEGNIRQVAEFMRNLLSVIGFGVFLFVVFKLIFAYNDLFTLSNLKSFLLPPIFTLLFLPVIYFTVLFMKYEVIFMNLNRYKFLSKTRKRKIKYSIIRYANINLKNIETSNKIILYNKRELQNETDIKSYLRKNVKLKHSIQNTEYNN